MSGFLNYSWTSCCVASGHNFSSLSSYDAAMKLIFFRIHIYKVSSVPVHILGNPKAAAHVAVVLQCWILYNVENFHSLFVESKHY